MSKNEPLRLQLVVTCHQPLNASEEMLERALKRIYMPILDACEAAENLSIALHLSGNLLDYLVRHHERFFLRLKALAKMERVEVLSGLFYGGIPGLLPDLDIDGQVRMSSEFWESFLGWSPRGFFLPELSWCPELPRLLAHTGLEYGFVSRSQVFASRAADMGIGLVERGGSRLSAFVMHTDLGQVLRQTPLPAWVSQVAERAAKTPSRLCSVWLRAEALALDSSVQPNDDAQSDAVVDWFVGLSRSSQIKTVLPMQEYQRLRPAALLAVKVGLAPEIRGRMGDDKIYDFADFALRHREADTLYRRMLSASERLREAVDLMEDEGLEDSWSGELATAQRALFSAQAADGYMHGVRPGFGHVAIRDAVMTRLNRVEGIIDGLVHGDDDWISTEEEDRDGDLQDEVFVANRYLNAWLQPALGAPIRSLEVRKFNCDVLDAISSATPHLPLGICDHVVREGLSMSDFAMGQKTDGEHISPQWRQESSSLNEDGDCSYELKCHASVVLNDDPTVLLQGHKHLRIPVDAAELQFNYRLTEESGSMPLTWLTQVPIRIGSSSARLLVDGEEVTGEQQSFESVGRIRVEAGLRVVEISSSGFNSMWLLPMSGFAKVDEAEESKHGYLFVFGLPVTHVAEARLVVRLIARESM